VLIAEILGSELSDVKVSVLSEMIQHHGKEEEKRSEGLFVGGKGAGLDVLGDQLQVRKQS
jgi:hypothetical protein